MDQKHPERHVFASVCLALLYPTATRFSPLFILVRTMVGNTLRLIGLTLLLCVAVVTCTSASLDPSEVQALLDMRAAWPVLADSSQSYPPWTTNTSTACGDGTGLPWYGIFCVNGHIQRMYGPNRTASLLHPPCGAKICGNSLYS